MATVPNPAKTEQPALIARLLVAIGDGNAYEVATFEVPITFESKGSALGVKTIEFRRPLANALMDAGKELLKELNTK